MSSNEVKALVEGLKIHVEGSMPIAGIVNKTNNAKYSIYEAAKNGIIRKGAAFELLEAQAACGKIIDVHAGRVVTVETASKTGVFDGEYISHVERAQRAFDGYKEPFKKNILSVCEAIDRHLIVERYGIRLLEAQIATGGIVDKRSPLRLSVDAAMRKNLIDEDLGLKLKTGQSKSYFDPNTGANLHYSELIEICEVDQDTGFLFLPVDAGNVTTKANLFQASPGQKRQRSFSPQKPVEEKAPSVDVVQMEDETASAKKKKKKEKKKKERKSLHEVDEVIRSSMRRERPSQVGSHQALSQVPSYQQGLVVEDEIRAQEEERKKKKKKRSHSSMSEDFDSLLHQKKTVSHVGSLIGEHERKIQRIASSTLSPQRDPSPEKERSISPVKDKKVKKDKKKKEKKEKKAKRARSSEHVLQREKSDTSIRSRSEERLESPFHEVPQVSIPMSDRFKSTSGGLHSLPIQQAYKIEINEEDIESEQEEMIYHSSPVLSQKLSIEDEQFEVPGSPKVKKEKKKKKKNKKEKKAKSSSPKSKKIARPSKPPAVISRRVVVVDPNTEEELNLEEALELGLIDEETALELCRQQGDYGM